MAGPTQEFNGLKGDHNLLARINHDINEARRRHMDEAVDGQVNGKVSMDGLQAAAAQEPATSKPGGVSFETGPDAKREALRRQGPPAELLRKHYNSP